MAIHVTLHWEFLWVANLALMLLVRRVSLHLFIIVSCFFLFPLFSFQLGHSLVLAYYCAAQSNSRAPIRATRLRRSPLLT
jgi:hypothetical protein